MSIRWITPHLGTGPYSAKTDEKNLTVIDVRDLVDKPGNPALPIAAKIEQGVTALKNGQRVVVCCDYGISRSNAIAAGIMASYSNDSLEHSLRLVLKATGETEVKLGPLMAVRNALGFQPRKNPDHKSVILVIGGSGFLGQAFQKKVSKQIKILAPSRKELDLSEGSTRLALLVEEHNVDWVIHLANPRVYTSNKAMGQTLAMLRNAIDVCVTLNIPLLYPSSWEIYSGYAGTLRVDEATPAMPRGPYGETKYLAETLIEHHVRTSGLRCALLRSSPVYGQGSDRPKFIYNFLEKAAQNLSISTHRYSNSDPMLDLLHVDDLVSAIIASIQNSHVGVLNIGTGVLTSTKNIAQMLVAMQNSHSPVEQISIDSETACIAMNWNQARRKIGWAPKISLEVGLKKVFSHILERNE